MREAIAEFMYQPTDYVHILPDLVILGDFQALPANQTAMISGGILGFGEAATGSLCLTLNEREMSFPQTENILVWCVGAWSNFLKCSWFLAKGIREDALWVVSERDYIDSREVQQHISAARTPEPIALAFSGSLWKVLNQGETTESLLKVLEPFDGKDNPFVTRIIDGFRSLLPNERNISHSDFQLLSPIYETPGIRVANLVASLSEFETTLVLDQFANRLRQFAEAGFVDFVGSSFYTSRVNLSPKGLSLFLGSGEEETLPPMYVGRLCIGSESRSDGSP